MDNFLCAVGECGSMDNIITMNEFVRRVQKWGSSIAVSLPLAIADAYDIKRGDEVYFTAFDKDTIMIRKVPADFYSKVGRV